MLIITNMKKILVLLIFMLFKINAIFPCTIGIASNSITTSNRPILWKSRDINPTTINTLRHADNLNYEFIGVTSPGENRMWMGVNEEGLAIANSLSNDLTVTEGEFNNGNLIYNSLGTCSDLEDFEDYLDFLTNSSIDLELRGNFVAFDASGQSKLYEINNSNYWIFEASPETSPYQIRTNHSVNGGGMDGIERFLRSNNIITELIENNQLSVNNLLFDHIRDVSDAQSQAYELPSNFGDPTPLIDTSYSIDRRNTISAVVIEGVAPGQDPKLTTMWLIMGNPFVSYAIPLVPFLSPNLSVFNSLSENSPELVNKLWSSDNDFLLDTSKFLHPNFSLLEELYSRELTSYIAFEELKEDWQEDDIDELIIIDYINDQANQALAFSSDLLYNFTSNYNTELAKASNLNIFPNPFVDKLAIDFKNSKQTEGKLRIYNIRGQLIREFSTNSKSTSLEWDGKNSDNLELPSGIYLIRYENGNQVESRKAVLLK